MKLNFSGLLGGHVIATYLKRRKFAMEWYADELLSMAKELGNRLLPAFNTTTGIPYPRVCKSLGQILTYSPFMWKHILPCTSGVVGLDLGHQGVFCSLEFEMILQYMDLSLFDISI